jgi:hypothetical protein
VPPTHAPVGATQQAFAHTALQQPTFQQPAPGWPTVGPTLGAAAYAPVPAFLPVRAKNPGWVIALASFLVLGFVGLIGAAVAIPVLLNSRARAAGSELQYDLMTVAAAEEVVRAQTGSYSADPAVVTAQLPEDITSRVAIVWADQTAWCGQAVPADRQTPQLYFSTRGGISDQPCG